jgi:Beta-galactosidase
MSANPPVHTKVGTLKTIRLFAAWLCLALSSANICGAAERALTLTPPIGAGLLTPNYFGIHVHNTGVGRHWPDIPIGSIRLWDSRVNWANLEPRQGEWDFSRLDEFVNWAESRRLEIVLPLGLSPRWASARPDESGAYGPGNSAEPADINTWRTYVRAISKRYRGRIAAYEIWNEANTKPFFTGSMQALAQLTLVAAEEIRRADQAALVVAPSGVGLDDRVVWPSQFLSLGVSSAVNAASFHIYHGAQPPESMIEPLLKLKAFNKAAGFESMPLWNTEFGYWIPNDRTSWAPFEKRNQLLESTAAAYLPRDLLLAAALGFRRFFWYSWDNSRMGLLDPETSRPRQIASVYEHTIRLLSGAALKSCSRSEEGLWTCILNSSSGARLRAIWVDPGATEKIHTLASTTLGSWTRLDGISSWSAIPRELKITSIVTLISEER